ncbi:ribonuclease H-like protein [Auricularia subglabra TFB-10046 SS5]|nr:ribonuclease H-like protein [Auricularia subglabra TFB-10046 SS5]
MLDDAALNPLLRADHHVIAKHRRVFDGQRPSDPGIVDAMSSRDCPRRFVPPTPGTRPEDLFYQRVEFSGQGLRLFHRDDDRTMLVYTDGACLDQDGGASGRRRAGCAFVYCDSRPGMKRALEGTVGSAEQTSNRAELRAVLFFLQMRHWEAGGADRIVVATDSEYVVEGACVRLETWVRRGWRTAGGTPVKNRDLWEALRHEMQLCDAAELQLLFWRIPRAWNQRADKLAKEAADMNNRDETPCVVLGFLM